MSNWVRAERSTKLIAALVAFGLVFTCGALADDFDDPALGLISSDLPVLTDKEKADGVKWPVPKGAWINHVWKNGPADKAGLDELDIITAAGGEKIDSQADLKETVKKHGFDKLVISYYRPITAKNRLRWRRFKATAEPISRRNLLAVQVSRKMDEATGAIIYRHRDSPKEVNAESSVDLYVIDADTGPARAYLRITYVADDWLFISGYTFVGDGKRIHLSPPVDGVQRDHDTRIWEWYTEDAEVNDKTSKVMQIANTIVDSSQVKLFYHGDQYRKERELSHEEMARVYMMLDLIASRPELKN